MEDKNIFLLLFYSFFLLTNFNDVDGEDKHDYINFVKTEDPEREENVNG